MTLETHQACDRWWLHAVTSDGETLARSARSWPDQADAAALARVLGLRPPTPDRLHVLESSAGQWYVLVEDYDGQALLYSETHTDEEAAQQARQRLLEALG